MNIEDRLEAARSQQEVPEPQFFDISREEDQVQLSKLLTDKPHIRVVDTYEEQLKEFFVLENPHLHTNPPKRNSEFANYKQQYYNDMAQWQLGTWVYLPWRDTLLHILKDDQYQVVRTGRNRDLITAEEQKRFYQTVVGIAGLSVGNSCALALALSGGAKHMRLADPDTLELTNLNRIRGSIAELTNYKVYMTAHQIYELDPYANLELFTDGITPENISSFFDGPPKLDIVIDLMDNLPLKMQLRAEAQKRKIPVLMATDNGDSGVLDIERYDLDDTIKPLHGRAEGIQEKMSGPPPPLIAIGKLIGEQFLGHDVLEERVLESLAKIGTTVATWPQLGTAATLNGVLLAAAVRRIANRQPLIEERGVMLVPAALEPNYNTPDAVKRRAEHMKELTKELDEAIKKAM